MNQDQIQSLRTQILGDITPLVSQATVPADSFDVLLRVIQAGGAGGDVYAKAYESTKLIQDKDQRLQALVSLLDEVNFEANQSNLTQNSAPAASTSEGGTFSDSELDN